MKGIFMGLVVLVLVAGCISAEKAPIVPEQTPVTVNQTPYIASPPVTIQANSTVTATPNVTLSRPATPKTTTPAPLPTLNEAMVSGDYCVKVDCPADDWDCQGMVRKYNTADSCLHLTSSGGVSMWMRHNRLQTSASSYRISGNRVIIGVPNGWTVDTGWPYNGAAYSGIYGRSNDTISCSFNGTALSCMNGAFTYLSATPDQL